MLTYNRRELLGLLGSAALAQGRPQPNILYIMADDHAAHAISAYGSRINRRRTSTASRSGGVRLANCFCTNSICTPSRAAILTGQYSHKNGVYTLEEPLDPKRDHVAKELQSAGYQTAMIGKWHLVTDPTGFDYWNILPGQGVYHNPAFLTSAGRKQYTGYCTDLIGDFTLDWLKQRDPKKPFFAMCHHKAPHRPWEPSAKYKDLFADRDIPEPDNLFDHYEGRARSVAAVTMKVGEDMLKTDIKRDFPPDLKGDALRKWAYQIYIKDYLRCIQSVDDNVGRVLDYLDAEGLASNTIVIYTSDQGFFLGDHGWFDKRLMYEESLRMPFVMRYPGAHPSRHGEPRHGAQYRFRAHVPRLRRRPHTRRNAGPQLPRQPGRPHAARLAQGDVLPLLDAQHQRPPRAGALRRAQRSLEAHLLLRQAARHEGRQSARHDARLGTLRHAQRPARNAQSLSRPQIRPRGQRDEDAAG